MFDSIVSSRDYLKVMKTILIRCLHPFNSSFSPAKEIFKIAVNDYVKKLHHNMQVNNITEHGKKQTSQGNGKQWKQKKT